jgi:nucleotide-binding universal stress UspA family protein
VDLSEESYAAVDEALKLVHDPTHIHVIHVMHDVSSREFEYVWNQVDQSQWKNETRAAIEKRFADKKYDGLHLELMFGSPGESITAYAQRIKADLIVMPSHGRKGLSRLLLGSVAERVIRLAHCHVLVTKGPQEASDG